MYLKKYVWWDSAIIKLDLFSNIVLNFISMQTLEWRKWWLLCTLIVKPIVFLEVKITVPIPGIVALIPRILIWILRISNQVCWYFYESFSVSRLPLIFLFSVSMRNLKWWCDTFFILNEIHCIINHVIRTNGSFNLP